MKNYHIAVAVFLLTVACPSGQCAYGEGNDDVNLAHWVANAVQWDSTWGLSEVTCGRQKSDLSAQLAAQNHVFRMEASKTSDGVVAILPELHRLVSVGLTSDGQLASITIEITCEPDLTSHYASLKALRRPPSVKDPRLKEHLQAMKTATAISAPPELPGKVTQLEIGPRASAVSSHKDEWSKTKAEALKTIEDAAQRSFAEQCRSGETAVAEVPDFELYDPGLLVLMTSKEGRCILPIGFDRRQTSADPYKAHLKSHCFDAPEQIDKLQQLIREHRAARSPLTCPDHHK